jgi:hypothetical protein
MRQPSFKIVLPQDLREKLEARAEQEGLSLAEFMRRTLDESISTNDAVARLQNIVGILANLVEFATGYRYDAHPAATETLRQAISIALQRMGARDDARFSEDDLHSPKFKLVPTNISNMDPVKIGVTIEALMTYPDDKLSKLRVALSGLMDRDHEGEEKRPRRRLRKQKRE